MSVRELSQEMPGPLHQREAGLSSEGADINEPFELVLLQEPQPPPLSLFLLRLHLKALD